MSSNYRSPHQSGQGSFRSKRSKNYRIHKRNNKPKAASTVDPSKFINKATPVEQTVYTPQYDFAGFNFDPRLLKLIHKKGYKTPSAIQDQSILPIMEGADLVGLANTGTGKTAAFMLPIINRLLQDKTANALVIVPTRELAAQINQEFRSFTAGLPLHSVVCVGGINIRPQLAGLKRGAHVIIATPGRLKDLIMNHNILIDHCSTIVLDEVDRMLDMGFVREIKFIISKLPRSYQSLCFSATMTSEIDQIISEITNKPVKVVIKSRPTSDSVDQDVLYVSSEDGKMAQLLPILNSCDNQKTIIFGETKYRVQRLNDRLTKQKVKSVAIHGNKTQSQRQKALDAFKNDRVDVLVATDIAARGLDIPTVTHVINYDTPRTYEDYIHRIGRTGRAGQAGSALTFVTQR